MKTMKFVILFFTLVLLGVPTLTYSQISRDLQVPMSTTPVVDVTQTPTYEGMSSTSPYNNTVLGDPVVVRPAAQPGDVEIQNMYRTTYDEQTTKSGRTKRRLGDDDESGVVDRRRNDASRTGGNGVLCVYPPQNEKRR